jgi:hypothetical protein
MIEYGGNVMRSLTLGLPLVILGSLLFTQPCVASPDDPTPTPQVAAPAYAEIRLYNIRKATDFATKIGPAFPALIVSAAADDLLVATPAAGQDPSFVAKSLDEFRRVVALLDLPRPQVTLQVWSVRVSSKNLQEIDDAMKSLQAEIERRNLRIQKALQFGWFKLMSKAQQDPTFLDPDFREYVTSAFVIDEARSAKKYSLGYLSAFSPSKPSLATMLLCLAASKDPAAWVDSVINDMKSGPPGGGLGPDSKDDALEFRNFRAYLLALVDPQGDGTRGGLLALRAAIADFLFQYKWALLYPHDFVPYDLQNSATVLDSMFAPAVDALNRDIWEYVQGITNEEEKKLSARTAGTQLNSRGIITVAALSGTEASVEGKIVSYFDVTTPPSLADMVSGMDQPTSALQKLFPALTGNPALIAGALGALAAQQKTFAEVDRGMKLVITPTTLATASSAELEVHLDSGDDGTPAADDNAPSIVGSTSGATDNIDRIAKHSVNTRVRVESAKLFEVSSFSFNVQHARPDGMVPVIGQLWNGVFGAVPGMGRLFKWRRAPDISAHRSLAIVSALIVPTSMDLALGIRVESDRKLEKNTTTGQLQAHGLHGIEADPLLQQVRPFHKKKMECLLSPPGWVQFHKDGCSCSNLTLDCAIPDAAEPAPKSDASAALKPH